MSSQWQGKFESTNHYGEKIELFAEIAQLKTKARTVSKDDSLELRLYNVAKFKNQEIPAEVHKTIVQYVIVVQGEARVIIKEKDTERKEFTLKVGDMVIIPMNSAHKIEQIGAAELKLISIYSERGK